MKQFKFLSPFLITAASILMLITGSFQAVAAQAGFVDPNVEGDVWDMDLQPDGRILIGGPFAKVGGQPRSCVARLNPDGTLDTSFQDPQVTGVDPSNTNVYAIARQQDGKVVIGGLFVSVAGQTRNYLARLNPDGSLDTQFAPVVSNAVSAVDVQSDGKIVVGGSFASVGGQSRSSVARLNADGSLDTTFQSPNLTYPGFGPSISAIAVQPDGKVLIGGYFITVDGQSRSFGTRLNADGTLDTGFNLTVSGPPTQFIVQPDGKLLVCGYFSTVNGTPRSAIARINADGTLDASFGNVAIPSGNVRTMGLQPDGKVVVGGEFSRIAGNDRDDLARLNADGTFDPSFQDPNANFGGTFYSLYSIIVQTDGKVLVGGQFNTVGRQSRKSVVRLLANGLLDVPQTPDNTLTVTKTDDTNDGTCNTDCSLREAVAAANVYAGWTQIVFDAQIFGSPQTITLTLGDLAVEQNRKVTITGPGADLLTVSGNNASRVLRVRRDAIVAVEKLKLSNGNGTGGTFTGGGAVYVEPNGFVTQLDLTNVVISNNTIASGGALQTNGFSIVNVAGSTITANNTSAGGIYFDNGRLSVTNTTISSNLPASPSGPGGGGISVGGGSNTVFTLTGSLVTDNKGSSYGGVAVGANATITSTVISRNQAASSGGGIYNSGTLTLVDSTVSENSASATNSSGGGIYNFSKMTVTNSTVKLNTAANGGGIFTSGGLTVANSSILGNSASASGGGIYNNAGGQTGLPVTITASVIRGNAAATFGGGINNRVTLDVENSTISDNTAANGGGAAFNFFSTGLPAAILSFKNSTISGNRSDASGGAFQNQAGTLNLTNSTVSQNRAPIGGGGAILVTQNGKVNLAFSTIAYNTASSAGGIRVSAGTVNANNSIIARNIGTNSTTVDFGGQLTSEGYNLIGRSTGATIAGDTNGNILDVDPRLDPVLRDNGGPTRTHALAANSPAIDAGSSTNTVTADQRGIERPYDFASIPNSAGGNGADIGAFELRPADSSRFFNTPFDFDGDGRSDISVFRPAGGEWWMIRSSDGGNFAAQFGTSSDIISPADFTGDGKADLAFFRPSNGTWYVLRSEDQSFYGFPFGTEGDIPTPADFDGDGKADAAVFRPSAASWFILRSSDGGVTSAQFGASGDRPVAADYDADGKADLAVFRPNGATGAEWWILRSTAGLFAATFGSAADRAVPGDWTGDGSADCAVWRAKTGQWLVLRSEDVSYYGFQFGLSTDQPAPGDYDGDGRIDAGVYRAASQAWYVNKSSGGTLTANFGAENDKAVPGAFVR